MRATVVFPVEIDDVEKVLGKQVSTQRLRQDWQYLESVREAIFNRAAAIMETTSIEPLVHDSDCPELID